jgi:hypothetical protein
MILLTLIKNKFYIKQIYNMKQTFIFSDQQVRSELRDWKKLLTIAVHGDQIIYYEFLEVKQTMTGELYRRFLNNLKECLQQLRITRPIILEDNARYF